MFGLEKQPHTPFEFELEKELKADPTKAHALLKVAEAKIQELKTYLRQGTASEEFDDCGSLLHAFAALKRVLERITRKKK